LIREKQKFKEWFPFTVMDIIDDVSKFLRGIAVKGALDIVKKLRIWSYPFGQFLVNPVGQIRTLIL
jgi:hypothetical protein